MPFVDLTASPLAPGVSPVRIHYRRIGHGRPIVFLHGGWGYEIYPCDRQLTVLAALHEFVIPSRSGYGKSQPISELPVDFHRRAATETLAFIDALRLDRPVLWGHSDGAIIALMIGLEAPERIAGAVVEAAHYYKRKPSSREFFESMAAKPGSLGPSIVDVLARDHGDLWPAIVERHSRTWLRIGEGAAPGDDFYDGRLGELRAPVLVVHGARDPRTEPGELDALRTALGGRERAASQDCATERRGAALSGPRHRFDLFADGGHSPHSERATADAVTDAMRAFVSDLVPAGRSARK